MLAVKSVDVYFQWSDKSSTRLTMSVQEAYNVMMMPAFGGFITSIVPNYEPCPVTDELSEMPKE